MAWGAVLIPRFVCLRETRFLAAIRSQARAVRKVRSAETTLQTQGVPMVDNNYPDVDAAAVVEANRERIEASIREGEAAISKPGKLVTIDDLVLNDD